MTLAGVLPRHAAPGIPHVLACPDMSCNVLPMTRTAQWAVTLKTGPDRWSTITVDAADHTAAVRTARRLLGSHPLVRVV